MRILAVGGGSGGHVTPVVAVFRELVKHDKSIELRFWCDRKFAPQARSVMHHFDGSIPVETIVSGKLRRYGHLSWWRQLLKPISIVLPNIRDLVFVGIGCVQSLIKLSIWRPDVVFAKGGFVCLPVGIAAKLLNIPLVIHDSDTRPGLTNRVLSRWAVSIATGAPLEFYDYPRSIARYVGIPISEEFTVLSLGERVRLKEDLGFSAKRPLVVITGGGQGAQRLNDAVAKCIHELLGVTSVVLISGTRQYDELQLLLSGLDESRFQLRAFVDKGMAELLGAADIVVARAGATTMLELAALAKPAVIVPNLYLTDQPKNAKVYAAAGAIEVIDETELEVAPQVLVDTLSSLLANKKQLQALGEALHTFAKPHAALEVAKLVLNAAK